MAAWPAVVLPAVLVALVIRLDAKLVGPYFTFPDLVFGMEGLDARRWYEEDTLRFAAARRFLYPMLMGIVLRVADVSMADIAATGFLTAGLLLWRAVFQGLPYGVSRRDWEVPVLYVAMLVSFTALANLGALIAETMRFLGDGNIIEYLRRAALETFLALVTGILGAAFFRGAFLSLRDKAKRRQDAGIEMHLEGDG